VLSAVVVAQRPKGANLSEVLLVADLLQPFDCVAIFRFLDGDMRHRRGCRGAVPVLLSGRSGDDVAGTGFLFRFAPALRPAEPGRDDQGLAAGMCVPSAARARLERDQRAADRRRSRRLEQRIDAHVAGESIPLAPCRTAVNRCVGWCSSSGSRFLENTLRDRKRRVRGRPTRVEREMRDDFDQLEAPVAADIYRAVPSVTRAPSLLACAKPRESP